MDVGDDDGYEEVNRSGHAWPCEGGGDRFE